LVEKVESKHHRLLIIEDDLDVAEMLTSYFRVQGYDVQTANWGEDGVRACQISPPDLIILDIRLPDIDGYQVAERLRTNVRTSRIPIIFLTEKRDRSDRLRGLKLGADDYITKPFDVQELRLRVRNALRRASLGPVTNPVTELPEGALVDEVLQELLDNGKEWVALLVSVRNLDAFRERYGFVTSDDVLRAISRMLQNAVRDAGSGNDFIGHLSANDFLIITAPPHANAMRARIEQRLGQALDYFYPLKDRLREDFGKRKLALRIREVRSSHGPFMDVDAIKEAFQVR
jgi:PleD family two-component response regulator